jgi:mannose-6-phosphate isomerase-like protein (cupin superfamily)
MPNWKKVITSGSDAILNQITSSGGINSTDITINDWGSVSASLASLDTLTYGDSDVKLKLNTEGVLSGSTFSSPSQGTVRATINGVNSDVDTGLQSADSPTFDSLTLTGDLTVLGSKVDLQVAELNVQDKLIKIASGSANPTAANGSGIYIDGADVSLQWSSTNGRFQFDDDLHTSATLNIGNVNHATTDTDKFLVLDSNGDVDYRTGTEVLSDIGGSGASNLSGAATEIPFFSSTSAITSSVRLKLNKNITTGDVLVHHGQFNVINDPSVSGTAAMQIIVGSGSSGDVSNPQYDSFLSMEQESATIVGLRAHGTTPTSAQIKMRTDVSDAYSIGRLTNPYGANTLRIKPAIIAEGGLSITGSLTISGSNTLKNIGPAQFSGSVNIKTDTQVQATSDTDKFVVLDGDQLKYRSGTQLYDDIGVTSLSSSIASDIAGLDAASGNYVINDTGASSNRLAIWSNTARIKGDSAFKILENKYGQGFQFDQWGGNQVDTLKSPAFKGNGLELGDNIPGTPAPFTASLTIHTNHGTTSNSVEKTAEGHQYGVGTHVIYQKVGSSFHIHYNISEGSAIRSGQLTIVVSGNEVAMTEYSTTDIGTGSTSPAQFSATASSGVLTLSITSAGGGTILFNVERMYSI